MRSAEDQETREPEREREKERRINRREEQVGEEGAEVKLPRIKRREMESDIRQGEGGKGGLQIG